VYVRFRRIHDRDFRISNSLNNFIDLHISFIEHNRAFNTDQEYWLMLLGFPPDFWSHYNVEEAAMSTFGKLMVCEQDYKITWLGSF
jgi:hypothetical protein